ncbi:MAG: glycosyltransferase [Gemmatimonadota bacterium]|jgi:glycosyltransferase involved in cell wall biosynthesis
MKLLAVAPQPFFAPRGTPLSVYYRSLVMAEQGVDVDLLTYGSGEDVDAPGVRVVRIPRFRFLEPVPVGPSAAKLFLDLFMVLWTLGLLLRRRYDVVQAHEESVFWCVLLQPVFRFRLVYDMHSSLPQQLVNFEFTRSRILIGLFEKLEDLALRRADVVLTICQALADQAVERMPDPGRHILIENSIFEPVRLAAGSGPTDEDGSGGVPDAPDAPTVVYAGTFEKYQGLDVLIRGFARAREAHPDAVLLLLGGNPSQVEEYRELARAEGLGPDACVFAGSVDRAVAQRCTREATVVTSPRTSGTNTPLKVYEQLDSGSPIVATRIHSHTQVLTDEIAFLAEPEPGAFGAALVTALTDEEERARRVANARRVYSERYARPAYVAKIRRALGLVGFDESAPARASSGAGATAVGR